MKRVWVCVPSKRPVPEVNDWGYKWRQMGYKVALWRDDPNPEPWLEANIIARPGGYPGYAKALNHLAALVLDLDLNCEWIVATGDDTAPDPSKHPMEIASECSEYFRWLWTDELDRTAPGAPICAHQAETMGVMQPTGDDWSDSKGRIIERIAGSPWLGREWCRRSNGGQGPLWPEYTHCFADEELWNVARKLGCYWQRPDLTHLHGNWARARGNPDDCPAFLKEATSPEHWRKYGDLFRARQAAGFPGSEPIA